MTLEIKNNIPSSHLQRELASGVPSPLSTHILMTLTGTFIRKLHHILLSLHHDFPSIPLLVVSMCVTTISLSW